MIYQNLTTFDNILLIQNDFSKDEVAGVELMSLLRTEQFATVEIWLPIVQRNSENFSTQNGIQWVNLGTDDIQVKMTAFTPVCLRQSYWHTAYSIEHKS